MNDGLLENPGSYWTAKMSVFKDNVTSAKLMFTRIVIEAFIKLGMLPHFGDPLPTQIITEITLTQILGALTDALTDILHYGHNVTIETIWNLVHMKTDSKWTKIKHLSKKGSVTDTKRYLKALLKKVGILTKIGTTKTGSKRKKDQIVLDVLKDDIQISIVLLNGNHLL